MRLRWQPDGAPRKVLRRYLRARPSVALLGGLLAATVSFPAQSAHLAGPSATYTSDADFDEGSSVNLDRSAPGQLSLDNQTKPFGFIWIAVSTKGTVVKVDTETGAILGEYRSSPDGMQKDPSRTTVDHDGNVWVTNRAEGGWVNGKGYMGSVVHIGLEENDQCVDRNGNGRIDTSRGPDDIKVWTNNGGANSLGGVSTAADECIIHYTRVNATGARHVSVNRDNNVWVSGTGEKDFDLISGETGEIIRSEKSVNCGGYGGLIDANGVIWSARPFLRWDTSKPLTAGNYTCRTDFDSYGLTVDRSGNVWSTALTGNQIRKFAPDGTLVGTYAHGSYYAQGVVADANGDIWVAHALWASTVGHLLNDGTYVGNVAVGSGPTGVSVDGKGFIWATNYSSGNATRIDPTAAGGVGAADLLTRPLGGNPYNYSDMTGSILVGAPSNGLWRVVHDSGNAGNVWRTISWNSDVPGDSQLRVEVAASDSADFGAPTQVASGDDLSALTGRYLEVTVTLRRGSAGESPTLFDLTIGKHASTLVADPALAYVTEAGVTTFEGLSAVLTSTSSGEPAAGRTIDFFVIDAAAGTQEAICSAITGADGRATCGGALEQAVVARGLRYKAVFGGDLVLDASNAEAPIASLEVEL